MPTFQDLPPRAGAGMFRVVSRPFAPYRSERELTFKNSVQHPCLLAQSTAELTACQERSRPHPVRPLYRTYRSFSLKQFSRRYGQADGLCMDA